MTRAEALTELHEIVDGIDREETDKQEGGWWETSTGADSGAQKLKQLERLIARLTTEAADG